MHCTDGTAAPSSTSSAAWHVSRVFNQEHTPRLTCCPSCMQLASLLPPAAVLGIPVSRGWLLAADRQLRDHAAGMGEARGTLRHSASRATRALVLCQTHTTLPHCRRLSPDVQPCMDFPLPPGLFEASRLLPSLGLLGFTPSREACRALAGAAGAELQAWGWRAAAQQQDAAKARPSESALRAVLQVRRVARSTGTMGSIAYSGAVLGWSETSPF